jgi:hypothetical protein
VILFIIYLFILFSFDVSFKRPVCFNPIKCFSDFSTLLLLLPQHPIHTTLEEDNNGEDGLLQAQTVKAVGAGTLLRATRTKKDE